VAADDWEHEMEQERIERLRLESIRQYHASKQSFTLNEDDVDTTPIPVPEAEPVYVAPTQRAKNTVVKAKKRIKRSVKNQAR
jgi:hypothetical protein